MMETTQMEAEIAVVKETRSPSTFEDRIDVFLRRRQRTIVSGLVVFAAIRIFVFAAAFPLFNSTDELDHFATVYEYAHGIAPGKDLPLVGPELARVFALYNSGEYLTPQRTLQKFRVDVPIEQLPVELQERKYQYLFGYWLTQQNIEAQSPPVYYLVASAWYRLGEALGLKGWRLPYWVRFFNVLLYALFVWIAYAVTKRVYPESEFVCVAVPALLAVWPQDVFFGINRNVLSPLLAAAILLVLFRSTQKDRGSYVWLVGGGLLTGAAFLTDVSNVVWFGALAIIFFIRGAGSAKTGSASREFAAMGASAMAAVLSPILWMLHNRAVTGDVTGSTAKMAHLGWTVKAWRDMWQHPIFSPHGTYYFLTHLMRTYWRGEFFWHGDPMRWAVADGFYVWSSYLLCVVFAVYWIRQKRDGSLQWLNGLVSIYLLLASVLFLAGLSLLFDFHECFYPSRAYPYFVSGRIIAGTLLPFAMIYAVGFETLLRTIRERVHPIIPFAVCCLFIVLAEIVVSREVFRSPFNFYSLFKM
jgi:hypothetical protein